MVFVKEETMSSVCHPLIKVRKIGDFISFIRCQQSLSLSYALNDYFQPTNLSSTWTKSNLNKNYSTNIIQEKLGRPHMECFGMCIIQWLWQFYACANLLYIPLRNSIYRRNTYIYTCTHAITINFAKFKQIKVNFKRQL